VAAFIAEPVQVRHGAASARFGLNWGTIISGSQGIGVATSAAALLVLITSWSWAQDTAPAEDPNAAIWKAASLAMIHGPRSVELVDQGRIELPEGYGFVPQKEAAAIMETMGNQTDERFLGVIFPTATEAEWFVSIDYEPSGYVKDDDARDWDADDLLANLRDGTEQGNERREQMGLPAIEVARWVEAPQYDASNHRLVWSAEVRDKGGQDPNPGVNYNTYVLGREGYISLNLVTSVAEVEAHKPAARQLLRAVSFKDGKRYADFNASTDQVAAYGLAALVGGVAAKKLGLLAAAAAFFVKFAKLIVVGVLAAVGGLVKFLRGRAAEKAS
jgi:uncharacterized membrane-anchored protein